jgi:hypothetical protein
MKPLSNSLESMVTYSGMKIALADRLDSTTRVIVIYVAVTLVLTIVALSFWLDGFSDRHSFLLRFIYFDPGVPGQDLTLFDHLTAWRRLGAGAFNPPGKISRFNSFNYCPPALFVIVFLLSSSSHPVAVLTAIVITALFVASFILAKSMFRRPVALVALAIALLTSYPFAFTFERGNIEGILWIPTAAGVYCFARRKYTAAAVLFAVAASIKPFPGLFLLLLIAERRYRDFFIGVSVALAITLGALFIIGPTIAFAFEETMRGFRASAEYSLIYNSSALGADHSLFAFAKLVIRLFGGWSRQGQILNGMVRTAFPYYVAFALVLFLAAANRLKKLPVLNQIFGLSILGVLLPPANYDYTLIVVYIPWSILLLALSSPDCKIVPLTGLWLMLCCAVLFTSQFYLLFGLSTSLSAPLKTLALCAILAVSLRCPLPVAALRNGGA